MLNIYDELIEAATKKHLPEGYDWRLWKAQLWAESALDPNALSPVGAAGIAQFMLPTWQEWAPKAGYPTQPRTDPEASIFTGAEYMADLIDGWWWPRPDFDRYALAFASYNAGMKNILDAQDVVGGPSLYAQIIPGLVKITEENSTETIRYVRKILKNYGRQITGDEPND